MNKKNYNLCVLLFFLFILIFNTIAGATSWNNDYFGGKVRITGATKWHNDYFGGKVTVREPGNNWHTSSFGGKIVITGWAGWSSWWVINYTNYSAPSSFTASNYNNSRIDLSWTKNSFADNTVIRGKKESSPTDINDGFLVYNSTGNSYSNIGLDLGSPYYYKAWSWNITNGYSSNNATDMAYTSPGNPSNLVNGTVTYNSVNLSWTNGVNGTNAVIRYKTGSYPVNPQDGTEGYNSTSNTTVIGSLSANTTYYFRLWNYINPFSEGNVSVNATTLSTETPDPPYNASSRFFTGGYLNITWNRGNRSDEDVVVRKSGSYPSTWDDGTVMDRTNNSTGVTPLYYSNLTVSEYYYYCIFSYNITNSSYSISCEVPVYGGLGLNCFNESNPSQSITFDILISNSNGSSTFEANSLTNTHWLDIEDIPYGNDTVFYVSSSGYKPRTYYYDIELGVLYNFSFYLPPDETSGGGGGGNGTCTLRVFTNVVAITNPNVNATVNLSHTLEDLIDVSVYNVVYNLRTKTDSHSVTNPAVNVSITLSKTIDEIIGVYVFNKSIYAGWILVPDDNYTVNSTHCEIDSSVLDDNSTSVKIDYYYLEEAYGTWVSVPDALFTTAVDSVEIDADAFNTNTTMVRVQYYYCYYDGETVETSLYNIQIVELVETEYSSYNKPVEDAKVTFKRYVNSTEEFVNVSVLKTDANGYVNLYLIPHTLYKVFINKSGYYDKISDYIPAPANEFGQTQEKVFRIYAITTVSEDTPETFEENCVFRAIWITGNETIRVTYIDKLEETLTSSFRIYEQYNGSLSLKNTTSYGADNDIVFYVSGRNTSRVHFIYLNITHTTLGTINNKYIFLAPMKNASYNISDLEQNLIDSFGNFDLGWFKTAVLYGPAIIILLAFAVVRLPGIGLIGSGAYLFIVNSKVNMTGVLQTNVNILISLLLVIGFIALIIEYRRTKK